jgi:RNA polymerase sigma factor (TIGR02999 family)
MPPEPDIDLLLRRWRDGDYAARDQLIARLEPELAHIASARLRREHNASLATGDLVNDAVIHLVREDGTEVVERAHFVALASRIMRNILIDHARRKAASKRDHHKVELRTEIDGPQRLDLIALDSALMRLKVVDAALMELVEMRYFGGMSIEDCAQVLGQSESTVKRRWLTARAWLTDALTHPIDRD